MRVKACTGFVFAYKEGQRRISNHNKYANKTAKAKWNVGWDTIILYISIRPDLEIILRIVQCRDVS